MERTLDQIMEVDHVIEIDGSGNVVMDRAPGIYGPEIHMEADWNEHGEASVLEHHRRDMIAYVARQGWEVITPDVVSMPKDPIIDQAYYVGGHLEQMIRETPGFWVVCAVEVEQPGDENGETREAVGWLLAHRGK